jgi:plastocyanin
MSQSSNEPTSQWRRSAVAALTALLILATLLIPIPTAAAAPQTHYIAMNARTFAFEPATLSVQRGDTVNIHFESLDAAHGLFIDGYGVDIHAEPGKSADVTFVADMEGKFKFRCSVSCGVLHPFMIGELIVEPNFPLARAATVTLIAAVGALAFFWRNE